MKRLLNPGQFNFNFHSAVSTWTPLATAFNSRPQGKINFLHETTGLFRIPELKTFEGFYFLKEKAQIESDHFVNESNSNERKRKMVEIFDDLSDSLCRVADLSEFIRIAHPKSSFAHAAEDACRHVSGIVEKLNTHRELYDNLKRISIEGDSFSTTPVDHHVTDLFLFDFEQSGIHLKENDRKQVVNLNEYILHLGQQFMNGAASSRSIPKTMLPENVWGMFNQVGQNLIVSGLYADSPNPIAREIAYKIYLHTDANQDQLLSELLDARHQLAKICGFSTYRQRALKSSTAESPENVDSFLKNLRDQLVDKAEKDFNIMRKMKLEENPHFKELAVWDIPYFTHKLKLDWFNAGSKEYSPYFSLGACMEGLNHLTNCLYGIQLENAPVENGEVWSSDVYKLNVIHKDEGLLGHIYCDFYERSGKPNQDCHFTIRGGRQLPDGSYQNPIVVLMLNFAAPRWSGPSLLTPSNVDNLFHEMGHALHSMLARTQYQHVTGTRCCTDFAEVPSILMEYFASHPMILRKFAKHFQTGEPMPEALIQKLCASKHVFAASELQVQVFYSALDQKYHDLPLGDKTTTQILEETQRDYYSLPYVPNTAWQQRFSHLVGYGAKYYSYLLSRAIASWIWQKYFEKDPLNSSNGEKYRRECLAHGGGKPARQLVADFLGKEVTPENLAQSLVNEIEQKREIWTSKSQG